MVPMNMVALGSIASTNPSTTTQQQNVGPIFPTMSHHHTVGPYAKTVETLGIFHQQIDESHHDLANLLTQQMATILYHLIETNNA